LELATLGLEESTKEAMYDALELICRNLEGINRKLGEKHD